MLPPAYSAHLVWWSPFGKPAPLRRTDPHVSSIACGPFQGWLLEFSDRARVSTVPSVPGNCAEIAAKPTPCFYRPLPTHQLIQQHNYPRLCAVLRIRKPRLPPGTRTYPLAWLPGAAAPSSPDGQLILALRLRGSRRAPCPAPLGIEQDRSAPSPGNPPRQTCTGNPCAPGRRRNTGRWSSLAFLPLTAASLCNASRPSRANPS
jgi:hypothetical protein